MFYLDLVLDTGELVRIQAPAQVEDDLHVTIEAAMKCRDFWSVNQFEGCTATFIGVQLQRVNMARVIGTL